IVHSCGEVLCRLSFVRCPFRAVMRQVSVTLCIGISAGCGRDSPPLIPRALLFADPERSAPQPSPDGTRLAYLAPYEGVLNVWVRTSDSTGSDRVLTSERTRGVTQFDWAGDGLHMLYLRDHDGDETYPA